MFRLPIEPNIARPESRLDRTLATVVGFASGSTFSSAAPVDDQKSSVHMLHWLHSLLPHLHHYGYVLVFIVVFLNNIGVPLPGETILLGAGFVLGKTADSMWQPVMAGTA